MFGIEVVALGTLVNVEAVCAPAANSTMLLLLRVRGEEVPGQIAFFPLSVSPPAMFRWWVQRIPRGGLRGRRRRSHGRKQVLRLPTIKREEGGGIRREKEEGCCTLRWACSDPERNYCCLVLHKWSNFES